MTDRTDELWQQTIVREKGLCGALALDVDTGLDREMICILPAGHSPNEGHHVTDRTEALDIEAIERTIRQGVQVLRLGVTEYARMDPADVAEHEVLTALDRLIQALRASNEERERVRALVEKWRESARRYRMSPDAFFHRAADHLDMFADELEAALSHPISPPIEEERGSALQ